MDWMHLQNVSKATLEKRILNNITCCNIDCTSPKGMCVRHSGSQLISLTTFYSQVCSIPSTVLTDYSMQLKIKYNCKNAIQHHKEMI